MAQDVESGDGIAKASGDVFGRFLLDEIGSQSFLLALFGKLGLEEEASDIS